MSKNKPQEPEEDLYDAVLQWREDHKEEREKEIKEKHEKEHKDWAEAKKAAADYAMKANRRDQEENNVPDAYWAHFWKYLRDNFTVQPK